MRPLMVRGRLEWKHVRKVVTFDGSTGNGEVGTVGIFTVTGTVLMKDLCIVCSSDLTEAMATATLVLGTANNTTALRSALNAVDLNADTIWRNGPSVIVEIAPAHTTDSGTLDSPVVTAASILLTVGGGAGRHVNGGILTFDIWWRSVSDGATLVAA